MALLFSALLLVQLMALRPRRPAPHALAHRPLHAATTAPHVAAVVVVVVVVVALAAPALAAEAVAAVGVFQRSPSYVSSACGIR